MPFPSKYPSIEIPNTDVWSFVFDTNKEFPDHQPAFIDGNTNKILTHADVREQSKQFGIGLQRLWEWKKGDVLALFSTNNVDYATIVFGTVWAGGVVTPVNAGYTIDELTFQLRDSGAKSICTIPALFPIAKAAATNVGIPEDRIIFVGDKPTSGWPENCKSLKDMINYENITTSAKWGKSEINPDTDLAYLMYSSGTTGKPKGVMTSHKNIIANVLQYAVAEGPELNHKTGKHVAILPFFHIYGLTCLLHRGLSGGIPIVIMEKFDLEQFLRIVQDHKITYVALVPPVVLLLAKHPLVANYDLSSIQMMNSGAAPLTKDLVHALHKRLGLKVKQGYGLTETSPLSHLQRWEDWNTAMGSCGRLIPNMLAKFVSEDDTELEVGQVGELWLKGPNVMLGYLNNPEATKQAITEDGFFKTGDIGYADKDGNFYITDRVKELIKYKGFQVAPAELEGLMIAHPKVDDVCIIGVYNEAIASEVPSAYVVLAKGVEASKATEEELVKYVEGKVAQHKRLRGGVRFVTEIPKSASGKILRRILKTDAAQEAVKNNAAVRAKL